MHRVDLFTPQSDEELEATRQIFGEYAGSLGVDLCFQNFDDELAALPGEYATPRGALMLARVDGKIVGCCALRPLDTVDYPNAARAWHERATALGFTSGKTTD